MTLKITNVRFPKLILPLVLVSHFVMGHAQVSTRGARSCGEWIEQHKEGGMRAVATESWLVGFLSGIAFESNKDFLEGTDNPSLFLWVTNYCQANPLERLTQAGDSLAVELMKENIKQ